MHVNLDCPFVVMPLDSEVIEDVSIEVAEDIRTENKVSKVRRTEAIHTYPRNRIQYVWRGVSGAQCTAADDVL
jgi:hypothetical protein